MLNNKDERELAHVERITRIDRIPGADRVELATVLGWHVMVRRGQFKEGDLAIYIEIDSRCPPTEPFKFLESKHYMVKTQRYFKGTVLSQGLLMSFEDVGLYASDYKEGDGLTEKLGIIYYEPEDNKRKAPHTDKYKLMAQRNQKLFKKKPIRWLMRRNWGKKLLFLFFGRKKDKKRGWPGWVTKTDEQRIQNCPRILEEDVIWTPTEKVDGSSCTVTIKRGKRDKYEFYVCSRNVVMDTPDRVNYYSDTIGRNIYWDAVIKYDIENVLKQMLNDFPEQEWITIQGEIYGDRVQKRSYGLSGDQKFAAFNLVMPNMSERSPYRWPTRSMQKLLEDKYGIPCVPIIGDDLKLPNDVDEVLKMADGKSLIDGGDREGIVFRSSDGVESFKAVSNEYLLKYH